MNTLPASSNTYILNMCKKAIVICSITKEVMISINLTIVYFNWGSGITEVQSVTINKKQRTLPTMSIFTESCESLAEFEIS